MSEITITPYVHEWAMDAAWVVLGWCTVKMKPFIATTHDDTIAILPFPVCGVRTLAECLFFANDFFFSFYQTGCPVGNLTGQTGGLKKKGDLSWIWDSQDRVEEGMENGHMGGVTNGVGHLGGFWLQFLLLRGLGVSVSFCFAASRAPLRPTQKSNAKAAANRERDMTT